MKKILLAGFAALAATALFAHDMPVVKKFTFDYDKLWTDTTNCIETPASMRMRQPIARWKGKPVEYNHDFYYLEYIVWECDSARIINPALELDSLNVAQNTVTFRHGLKTMEVDFSRPDAFTKLATFVAPPEDWRSEGMTYGYEEYFEHSEKGTLTFPRLVRIISIFPEDSLLQSRYFLCLSDYCKTDPAKDFTSFCNNFARKDYHEFIKKRSYNPESKFRPLPPDVLPDAEYLAEIGNDTYYIFPEYVSDKLLTFGLRRNENSISETVYRSYDPATGKMLTANDIFNAENAVAIAELYLEHLNKYCLNYRMDFPLADDKGNYYVKINTNEVFDKNKGLDAVGAVAFNDEGCIFEFDFNANGIPEYRKEAFVVPYEEIGKYLKPAYRELFR